MRLCILASVLCILTWSQASGQWLETTIYLPDSAGGVLDPRIAASDAAGMKVYVGGSTAGVSVLDGETGERLYRIQTGADVSAICCNSVRNKVYIASRSSDTVTVADGTTGQVVASVPVGAGPTALAWHPTGERVYVACAGRYQQVDSLLYEIDCSADTVRAIYRVGKYPVALCYNRVNNTLYCANRESNTVSAVSCSEMPLVIHIPVGEAPTALACNPLNNKVYCANTAGLTVSVISGTRNQVEDEVPTGTEPADLCYDSLTNTVFCANSGSANVAVIDGARNNVIATMVVGSGPRELEFNPDSNRVYCLSRYEHVVHVIDGSANRVMDSFPVTDYPSALCYTRAAGRLHCLDDDAAVVTVFDCGDNSVKARTRVGIEPEALAANPSGSKLYCFGGTMPFDSVNLSVVDADRNSVVRTVEVRTRGRPEKTCYNAADDKLYYVGFGTMVGIIDARADSVLAYVEVPDNAYGLAYAPAVNKVYVGGGYFDGYVAAVDGRGDTLVATVAIPGGGGVYEVCHNPEHNTVYGFGNQRSVFTVIDCGADTVAGQFTGERCPGAALSSPLSDKVYMVAYVSGLMLVIDGTTNQIRTWIGVGNGARDICLNTRENKVYSSGVTEHSLAVIDGEGDSLLARIEFPDYTGEVEYDPDYSIVYCTYSDDTGGYVWLIDGATERLVGRIRVGGSVGAMLANPALDRVYVADQQSSCLRVIRTGAGGISGSPTGPEYHHPGQSLVNATLTLRGRGGATLLDLMGRKVMELRSGPNDVRHLAPGVYFLRQVSGVERKASGVTKVIIAR